MRRGESLCFGVYVNWAEVGFRYKSNSAFCIPFFFFFFFFFFPRPELSVSADSGPSPCESARVGAASARVG